MAVIHGDENESSRIVSHQGTQHISFDGGAGASTSTSSRTSYHLCSIASWYPHFSEHTFRTEIIPVSRVIVDWLVQDGISLPDIDSAFPTRVRDAYDSSDEYSSDDDGSHHDHTLQSSRSSLSASSTSSTSSTFSGSSQSAPAELRELYAGITAGIERLGGAVVPKMQWSCPKDACWILPNNTLKCTSANDVCLLLKSSDRIAYDIETMREISPMAQANSAVIGAGTDDACPQDSPRSTIDAGVPAPQHVIALRTYYDLKPGREFRCFVKNGTLCAISQRDQEYHQHLVENVDVYREKIVGFFETCIRPRLFLDNVVFDCYVPEGSSKLRLVDFNVFGEETSTHPLLFSWDELLAPSCDGAEVTIRIVHDPAAGNAIRPSETSLYGVPYDFVHEGATEQLREFLDKASLNSFHS